MSVLLILLCLLAPDAMAEAKTTFGATNASTCYRQSLSPFTDYGLRFCTDAIRQDDLLLRDRAATYTNRGIIYAAHGKLEAAMEDHNEALLLSPRKGKVYVNRGNVFHQIHEYEQALADYDNALELGDVPIDIVYYNRALTLIRLKRWDDARESLEAALEINSTSTRVIRKLEQFNAPKERPSPTVVELENDNSD